MSEILFMRDIIAKLADPKPSRKDWRIVSSSV
jgi:hypothetical protein